MHPQGLLYKRGIPLTLCVFIYGVFLVGGVVGDNDVIMVLVVLMGIMTVVL